MDASKVPPPPRGSSTSASLGDNDDLFEWLLYRGSSFPKPLQLHEPTAPAETAAAPVAPPPPPPPAVPSLPSSPRAAKLEFDGAAALGSPTYPLMNPSQLFEEGEEEEEDEEDEGDIGEKITALPDHLFYHDYEPIIGPDGESSTFYLKSSLLSNKRRPTSDSVATTTTTTSSAGGKPVLNEEDYSVIEARRVKGRMVARNSRERKRLKYEGMKEELQRLTEFNNLLQERLNLDETAKTKEEKRRLEILELQQMLEKNASDEEIHAKLKTYSELYADFGRERRDAIHYHLHQLKALLLPNKVSKATLWCLGQDDSFYDEKRQDQLFGGSFWQTISTRLEITPEQKVSLMKLRPLIRAQRERFAQCLEVVQELDARVGANVASMQTQFGKVMKATTPRQQAMFLTFIESNRAALSVLHGIWARNGAGNSERSSPAGGGAESPPRVKTEKEDEGLVG